MPELPEVEVVKRSLKNTLIKLVVKDVKVYDANLRYKVKKELFKQIVGLKILRIKRRSKYLIFLFDKGMTMIAHLGMTGKFFFVNKEKTKFKTSFYYNLNSKDSKHDRVIFVFKNNTKLIYNDVRKFGFLKLFKSNEFLESPHIKILGPEPLESEFNFNYFKKYLYGKNRFIKDLLMDQKFVSGLGNIYVNEILFKSGIKPNKRLKKLKDFEIRKILINIKKVLKKAIQLGGSSIKNFSSSDGQSGNFQQHFNVYGMLGEKCSNIDCTNRIKKIVISNRASFFCSNCQK